jgi:hypothetical protein
MVLDGNAMLKGILISKREKSTGSGRKSHNEDIHRKTK